MIKHQHAAVTLVGGWTPETSRQIAFPNWICPKCEDGVLRYDQKSAQLASSVSYEIQNDHIPHWDDYGVFTAMLYCQRCYRGVAVSGEYVLSAPDGISWVVGGGFDGDIDRKLTIRSIYPAPNLIEVPEKTTSVIKDAVLRSFPLYWSDARACGGAIRIAIEEAVDHLTPRRLDRKGRPVTLGTHLQDLEKNDKYKRHAEAFQRIVKTLGNAGAHGDAVSHDNLLVAFELLEIELGVMFEDDRRNELMSKLTSES